jgi:hypothetical protein
MLVILPSLSATGEVEMHFKQTTADWACRRFVELASQSQFFAVNQGTGISGAHLNVVFKRCLNVEKLSACGHLELKVDSTEQRVDC